MSSTVVIFFFIFIPWGIGPVVFQGITQSNKETMAPPPCKFYTKQQ